MELGAIDVGINAGIILLAIITCTASPLLFNRLVPATECATSPPVVVVGEHRGAFTLAERLSRYHETVILALPNGTDAVPSGFDYQVVRLGEVTHEALRAAGLGSARTLVALCEEDAQNLRLSQISAGVLRSDSTDTSCLRAPSFPRRAAAAT